MKSTAGDENSSSKKRIRDAAMELFAQKGYAGTTTNAIAKLAGVNEVTIFRIFGNKKTLFYDVYLMMTPRVENMELSGLTGGEDIAGDLATFLAAYMIPYVGHMPVYRLSLQLQDEIYERELYYASFDKIRGLIAQFVGYLQMLRAKGAIAQMDYNALAEFVFSLLLVKAQEISLAGEGRDGEVHDMGLVEEFARSYGDELAALLKKRS